MLPVSTAALRAVRSKATPPRTIRCAGVRLCRRRCAATRARSSATRKGFDKKSSAPMPSPSSTAASSVRALRNRMGTSVRLRMRRQTAKPSSPGIITSSRIQSAQRQSASVRSPPACRVSTRWPSRSKVVRISLQSSRLSSTARIFATRSPQHVINKA